MSERVTGQRLRSKNGEKGVGDVVGGLLSQDFRFKVRIVTVPPFCWKAFEVDSDIIFDKKNST